MEQIKVLILLIFCSAYRAQPTNLKFYPDSDSVEPANPTEIAFQSNNPTNSEETHQNNESSGNLDNIKSNEKSLEKTLINDMNKQLLKDVDTAKIQPQLDVLTDGETNFLLFGNRMPDLTVEECNEINKVGATPLNFLKILDVKKNIKDNDTGPMQILTPIYITVPIVINSQPTLPLSLSIGGQNIPLNISNETKLPIPYANVENSTIKPVATPTSIVNNLSETPSRETNRHRSNLLKKMYAHNNISKEEEGV